MTCFLRTLFVGVFIISINAADDFKEFEYNSDEVMIAQESNQYQSAIKSPVKIVKPNGVTNSHRPQYNLDSIENDGLEEYFLPTTKRTLVKNYKWSSKIRSDGKVRDAVLRALERNDHDEKFAEVLPIIRAMSNSQRLALASLVASQATSASRRSSINLAQVRSIIGNNTNTTDTMIPILLDTVKQLHHAAIPDKEMRGVTQPQILRRSFVEDPQNFDSTTQSQPKHRTRRIIPPRTLANTTVKTQTSTNRHDKNNTNLNETNSKSNKINERQFITRSPLTTTTPTIRSKTLTISRTLPVNSTFDLIAESSNQTLAQDLPVAEKLRASNRYVDRKVNIRRGTYQPKPLVARRTTAEPTLSSISRRRPIPARKLPTSDPFKCELFTNTLCLHSEDYPADAIIQSIRRNKVAAGALLADFKDPGDGALDGVTADQEAKYTADHYLIANRRGDTANRDFAGAGEAGFMCPSTVKYARPQRARATSGQWKYIVNTGEHTQTLRLEKCLKPKDSCTYLTDNFKSKCVQVYNYHRLLTWDQQNGLHMDIFKVPTCCSCHIEGYSVSFPPLGHRIHETSSEHFPGEDLSSEQGNNAFEAVQSTIQRPSVKSPPFIPNKILEPFSSFSDNQNLISGQFNKINDNDEINKLPSNPIDSYGNTYLPDSFNQASLVKNIRRPPSARNPIGNSFESITLPSYLEPPIPSATSTFSFAKDSTNKFKFSGSPFKRGAVRPNRRPIRKKISGELSDLSSSGTTAIESYTHSDIESSEAFDEYSEEPEIGQTREGNSPKLRVTIGPKLQAVTTELNIVTPKIENMSTPNDKFTSNGKRINYNYHPIIDFFGKVDKNEDESIDRDDSDSYVAPAHSGWKPIKQPTTRSIQNSDLLEQKTQ